MDNYYTRHNITSKKVKLIKRSIAYKSLCQRLLAAHYLTVLVPMVLVYLVQQ